MAFNNYPAQLQPIAIVQTVVGVLQIIGAIIGGFWVLLVGIATLGIGLLLIPIPIVFLTIGVLSLISGIKGLQRNTNYNLAMGVGIAQMVLLLSCDMISFGCGLTAVILLSQPEVKAYFR